MVLAAKATTVTEHSNSEECAHGSPGHVIYRGESGDGLGACLDGAKAEQIAELTITSHGGDAWKTLQVVARYEGRINLVRIDGWCNSSCANYVIPAARRLIVMPDSYVVVHGSIEPAAVERQLAAQRDELRRTYPQVPPADLDHAQQKAIDDVRAKRAVQDDFEKRWLSCREWLHPDDYISEHVAPASREAISALVVSETMARRCLKHTEIQHFWSVRRQEDLPNAMKEKGAVLVP